MELHEYYVYYDLEVSYLGYEVNYSFDTVEQAEIFVSDHLEKDGVLGYVISKLENTTLKMVWL